MPVRDAWFAGPDPRLPGGVNAALAALLPELPEARRLVVGRRLGRPWAAWTDPLRAATWTGPAVLVQNPSLRPRALARDLGVLSVWRGPVVWWLHGGSDAAWAALPAPLVRAVARRATWVALAERFGARLIDLGAAPERVRVIPPPYDPHGVPHGERRGADVLFLGRLTGEKGADLLLEAFARATRAPARLILAGEGPLRASLAARARALGVADRVVLPGFLDHQRKRAALAGAAVLALPSRDEAVPVAVIEALAAGVPVVATEVGAVPETVGRAGIVVPRGDVDALAGALVAILADPGDRPAIARRRAASYHPRVVAASWRALLAELG